MFKIKIISTKRLCRAFWHQRNLIIRQSAYQHLKRIIEDEVSFECAYEKKQYQLRRNFLILFFKRFDLSMKISDQTYKNSVSQEWANSNSWIYLGRYVKSWIIQSISMAILRVIVTSFILSNFILYIVVLENIKTFCRKYNKSLLSFRYPISILPTKIT